MTVEYTLGRGGMNERVTMKRAMAAGILVLASASRGWAADPVTVTGKVDAVTVYRGEALVTRLVDLPGPAGLKEIVVGDLPDQVEGQSVFAEAVEGAEVRSVLYRERPVSEDVRPDVRKLDGDIKLLGDQLAGNLQNMKVVSEQRDYLTKLESFSAPTANMELSKGVLNAETLKTLTNYIFEQRKSLADQELKLTLEQRGLNEQMDVLKRSRDLEAAKGAKTVREAVIFVDQKAAGAKMRVRYLVESASWDPSYNVRADKTGKVTLEYNASITQQSGEDWPNVQMTLSTATPALVADAPEMKPLPVALAARGEGQDKEQSYADLREEYRQKLQEAEQARNNQRIDNTINGNGGGGAGGAGGGANSGPVGGNNGGLNGGINSNNNANNNNNGGLSADSRKAADDSLNDVAGQEQVAELLAGKSDERQGGAAAQAAREVISVTYELPSRTSLPSRSDQQLIQVASVGMKGSFYKLAQPLLTAYVYDTAQLANDSKIVLLAGPVSSYMDGQFVGHTELPTVAVGESFTIGFGIDSSLRATRERIDKAETTQGGNRLLTYTYRLELDNFGDKPANVRLIDRLPSSDGGANDVQVKLETGEADLSKDADYQRGQRKKGLLRWDVEVPAQAIGEKAFAKQYKFNVEYDRFMTIVAGTAAGPAESDASRRLNAQLSQMLKSGSLSAENQSLEKVLAFIKETNGLNMTVNWASLQAAGVEKTTPVTIDLKGVTVQSALSEVLAGVNATTPLGFKNVDGVVHVSTRNDLMKDADAEKP